MVDAIRGKAGFTNRLKPEEASKLNKVSGNDDGYFDLGINDAYIPEFLEEYDEMHQTRVGSGVFDGMIFMSNNRTKKECFRRKLFGLPGSYASIVKHVKPGMKLFLFEYERREMHGLFEATTSGAMNIEPDAFKGSGRQFPAQVRFSRLWDCYPLSENDFKKAIHENYHTRKEFYFALSGDQVAKLMDLFCQQKIELRVSVRADYDEDSDDIFKTGIRHETAGFCGEIERNMSKRDCHAQDTMYGHYDGQQELACTREPREIERNMSKRDWHAGDTMYGHYDGQQLLACTRETYSKNLQCAGNVYAGQTMHDISNAGPVFPSTGGLIFEDLRNDNFHAGQTINDISGADQRLGSHYVQLTNSDNFERLNSELKSYYVRHLNFVENNRNAVVPRDTAINADNANKEIYDNSYREFFFPSNSQHHDNLYYNGTRMSQGSLSIDSLPLYLTKPVIEMSSGEGSQEVTQLNLTNSPVNLVSNSSRLYADDFEDGYCFQKQSVFSRLKRVPEIDVLHEKQHALFRQTYQTNFPHQKHKRKSVSLSMDEIESSDRQDKTMSDAESTDEPTVKDGIVINFKRRSQVSKYGKEATPQVEGETNPSDGEQSSNKQKRRKLIRPQFDSVKVYENTMDVIQSCSKECPSQSVLPTTAIVHVKMGGSDSRQESGEVLANVKRHSDCCNVQPVEAKNKGLAHLDGSESFKKEWPCHSVCPSSEILATQNTECDCGQENGKDSLNKRECADSCNLQVRGEGESQDIPMIDLNGSESYRKEFPCQSVCPSAEILATKNTECDCEQENGKASSNERECADSCNLQVMGEVESRDIPMIDLNGSESYRKGFPCQSVCSTSEILATQNTECDCEQENVKASSNKRECADSCNLQVMGEVESQDIPTNDFNGSESYRKEFPCQSVCPTSEILATQNTECDCEEGNVKASSNMRECADSCNLQVMREVESQDTPTFDLNGSESYRKEFPCQSLCPTSKIFSTQNTECDCEQENGKASSDKRECADSCNLQVMGEVESQVITMMDLNKPLSD